MEVGEEGDYIPIAEADSNRDPSAYQRNALTLGQSSPQSKNGNFKQRVAAYSPQQWPQRGQL